MSAQNALYIFLGALILLVAWLPLAVRQLPLSVPIVMVLIGMLLVLIGPIHFDIKAARSSELSEQMAQAVVLIALMGSGLKIDRPFAWRSWQTTWRLLGIAMPLTILAMTVLCRYGSGFSTSAALLLAAALAPTDPVLASDVEVGPPGSGEEGEVRFALTSEAGLNDGLAFPFVALAMFLTADQSLTLQWLGMAFVWKVAIAVALGWTLGRFSGWLVFRLPRLKVSETGEGLVALGVTFLSFAVTQTAGGYGFVAVFITALVLRSMHRDSKFHNAMVDFSGQIERLLAMLLLLFFGCAIGEGLLDHLRAVDALVGLALLFIIRPVAGWIALLGTPHPAIARAATAFFGIRGIGTLYYMLYALNQTQFEYHQRMWSLAGFVILCSIVIHGLTATPVMRHLDRVRARATGRISDRSRSDDRH